MKKILLFLGVFGIIFGLPVTALAESAFSGSKEAVCAGVALDSSTGCSSLEESTTDPSTTVRTALNILTAVVGIIAVVMMIIAGVKYITSQGDSNQVNSAKNTIIYSVVGLVVVVLTQVVVRFVIARFD
jgi:uncharacterized membrane protein YidH (DUF202 family)